VLVALAVGVGDADARKKKKRVGHGKAPPFSHIVLDAKTGKALEAFKADERRFPASLTKVMTLYLLFEQMEAGKLKLGSPLKVSQHAASRPPSKLGLAPGSSIRVDDAIKALVTKSANDVAVVVAEAIGGSEAEFARMMTSKARSLGMSRTIYANASGLPNPRQVTTARDQAILGRAIQWHYPRQYKYFATNSFTFQGREIYTHNRLLGSVDGVDGIKTGYTHASGFNLVTSVRRDRRHIVAVVIGGRTSRSRDAFMRKLIREYIDDASKVRTVEPTPGSAIVTSDSLPTPPARPEGTAMANLANDKAETPAQSESAQAAAPVQTGSADASQTPPAIAVATAAEPREVSRSIPARETAPAPADRVIVLADASLDRRTSNTPDRDPVASLARFELPVMPAWFPYIFVAFIGCAGSFASSLWQVGGRLMPRRRIA
jgi:D-alanyl-D-alanine carboxypeptidase